MPRKAVCLLGDMNSVAIALSMQPRTVRRTWYNKIASGDSSPATNSESC